MKKFLSIIGVAAVLLTGCGYAGDDSPTANPGADGKTLDFVGKNVSEIKILESGGEDGRINNWSISQNGGRNVVVLTDRMKKTSTYNISDEDFQALTHIDFSDYIGVKADTERLADAVYYNIEIIYDDTMDIIEVYVPELWRKLYEIIGSYEPLEDQPDDSNSETPFPENGTIGEYEYRIDNHMRGVFEIGSERGYYFDEENHPDSPLFVYICSGEQTIGTDIYISDLTVDANKFIITVTETSPDNAYDAVDWPQCMIEINPKPENIEVKSTNGVKFKYIDSPQCEPSDDLGEIYFKEVRKEDIMIKDGIKYAKNQLLISCIPGTDKNDVKKLVDEIDADIVGYIELTADYQIEFRSDKTLDELSEIADYIDSHSFVLNVTLNLVSETSADEDTDALLQGGYIAVLHGGGGEITHQTYVFKSDEGYSYINTTSTTVSWGSPQWEEKVTDKGSAKTKEDIVEIAKENGADAFVTIPEDSATYKIKDFLTMEQ